MKIRAAIPPSKAIQVDHSNDESIKHALDGVDVVIGTLSITALDVEGKIAAAAKEAGVKFKLFCPSEFGGITMKTLRTYGGGRRKFRAS